MRALAAVAAGTVVLAAAAMAADNRPLIVRPAALLEPDAAVGVRIASRMQRAAASNGVFPRTWSLSEQVDAPLFLDPDRNPETLRAQAGAGLGVSLYRPRAPGAGGPSTDERPDWDYGSVALEASLGAEAPQGMDTADLTAGVLLGYEHELYYTRWFVPEVELGWHAVFCVGGDDGEDAGDGRGWRLDGAIGWYVPADRQGMPGPLRPLWLRLRGRGFRTFGLTDADPVRREQGLWGSAELAYRCDRWGPLHEIYIRSHAGKLPQQLEQKRGTTIGVSLWL
jgi:hypothetical protein